MSYLPGGFSVVPMGTNEAVSVLGDAAVGFSRIGVGAARVGVHGAKTAWIHGKDFVDQQKELGRRIYLNDKNGAYDTKNDKAGLLRGLFDVVNKEIMIEFHRYCCKEFGCENFFCFVAIEDYRKNPTFAKRNFIKSSFLDVGSINEVNIPAKVRRHLISEFELIMAMEGRARGGRRNAVAQNARGTINIAPLSIRIFDSLYKETSTNLCDTYARYSGVFGCTLPNGMKYFRPNLQYKSQITPPMRADSNNTIFKMQAIGFNISSELLL